MTTSDGLEEVLDELCMRFLDNMPPSEYSSFERIFFAIEAAHWHYIDFSRVEDPKLPKLEWRSFVRKIFAHSPLLQPHENDLDRLLAQFKEYKLGVPTCGAALLCPDLSKVVMVRAYGKSGSWGFPKGKIAKNEDWCDAAVREVHEETGYDFSPLLEHEKKPFYMDATIGNRTCRIFVIPNVPLDTKFVTQTRNEIAEIAWKPISELPDPTDKKTTGPRMWFVSHYTPRLKAWIRKRKQQQQQQQPQARAQASKSTQPQSTDPHAQRTPKKSRDKNSQSSARVGPDSGQSSPPRKSPTRKTDKDAAANTKRGRRGTQNKDAATFGLDFSAAGGMTDAERNDFFEQYVRSTDRRVQELGIKADQWPVPVIMTKDLDAAREVVTSSVDPIEHCESARDETRDVVSLGAQSFPGSCPFDMRSFAFDRDLVLAKLS